MVMMGLHVQWLHQSVLWHSSEKKKDKNPELSRADREGVHLGADSFEDRAAPPSTG